MSEGKVTLDITMSLDGYIAGPNDEPENGLGDEGERLHEWVYELETWRKAHGLEGGEMNQDAEMLDELLNATGAVIVGKRMFDNAGGWGEDPPFKVPVFVLTHEAREELTKGETTFTFVTEGPETALAQARAAAGDKNVSIGGGASTVQQFLEAGLLDEMRIHIAPLILGGGVRLFDNIGAHLDLEPLPVHQSPRVTHLRFRLEKK